MPPQLQGYIRSVLFLSHKNAVMDPLMGTKPGASRQDVVHNVDNQL